MGRRREGPVRRPRPRPADRARDVLRRHRRPSLRDAVSRPSGKLVLASTAAKVDFPAIFARFEELGGPEIARIAETYWTAPTVEKRAEYFRVCVPFYRRKPVDPAKLRRALVRNDTALHFNGPGNEQGRMDFRPVLGRVRCSVLVMAGAHDPLVPPGVSEALVAALPPDRVRFECFMESGHDLFGDEPERAFAVLREFITAV